MRALPMKKLGYLALCLALLTACAPQGQTDTIYAMDTVMELTAYGPDAQAALTAAEQEVNRLEGVLSAQRPDSEVAALNQSNDETAVLVTEELARLLDKTLELCGDTGGALDVTIYPAMEAWGFYSGDYHVLDEQERLRVKEQIGYEAVTVDGLAVSHCGRMLDLGAVGKGYAADRIVELWREMGLTSGLLNLGGNVQCLGARPDGKDWSVDIRDPDNANKALATVSGRDMAVVTSGSYQRYFEENGQSYHHILDPETCAPARSGARSVSVIGPSGLVCDALSTALFTMTPREAAEYWQERHDFDFIYYTEEGTLWYTSGLKGRITLREGLEGQMRTWKNAGL